MKFFVFSNKSFLLLSFLSYEILGTTNFQRTILYDTVLPGREERWKNFTEINAISRPNAGSFVTSFVARISNTNGYFRTRTLISFNFNRYTSLLYRDGWTRIEDTRSIKNFPKEKSIGFFPSNTSTMIFIVEK